jgi:hypothetical protein
LISITKSYGIAALPAHSVGDDEIALSQIDPTVVLRRKEISAVTSLAGMSGARGATRTPVTGTLRSALAEQAEVLEPPTGTLGSP